MICNFKKQTIVNCKVSARMLNKFLVFPMTTWVLSWGITNIKISLISFLIFFFLSQCFTF